MHRSTKLLPRALLASAFVLVLTVPGTRLWAGAFDGRWVEIPYCYPPGHPSFGNDCDTNPGWPAVEAIHVTLTKDKKLLYWRNSMWRKNIVVECWRKAHYWDPAATMDQTLPATDSPWPAGKKDAFCAGHSQLGDGRILVAGGEDAQAVADTTVKPTGINTVWIFDPARRNTHSAVSPPSRCSQPFREGPAWPRLGRQENRATHHT